MRARRDPLGTNGTSGRAKLLLLLFDGEKRRTSVKYYYYSIIIVTSISNVYNDRETERASVQNELNVIGSGTELLNSRCLSPVAESAARGILPR